MKPTRIFIDSTKYSWNCWVCGVLNTVTYSGSTPPTVVECPHCLAKRKVAKVMPEHLQRESKLQFLLKKRIKWLARKRMEFLQMKWTEEEQKKVSDQTRRKIKTEENIKKLMEKKNEPN